MPIHFPPERWDNIRDTYQKWWDGTLDRPLFKLTVSNAYPPERNAPAAPLLTQANVNDFNLSPEDIIDTIDYYFIQKEFLGDAFPYFNFGCFGPGVVSAFCGARLDNHSGNVWFFPTKEQEIQDIHIQYDPNSIYAQRIKSIYRAGLSRWNGNVLLGTPDLGGTLDIIAIFRGTENLLMDLYDEPEEVARLIEETNRAWFDAYHDLMSVLHPQHGAQNPGYSDWNGLYSATPSYVLQSDFSFNISPAMFSSFTLPSLKEQIQRLPHTIYHLDGVNQLHHLDYLLALPDLNAIQWVFGDGLPTAPNWMEVYQKIEKAGKGSHVVGPITDFDFVANRIQHGLYFSAEIDQCEYQNNQFLYQKYLK